MTGTLLVLLFLGLVGLSLWAIVDSALQPARAYAETGIRQGLVTALLLLTCAVGAVVYAVALRPRLVRAGRPGGRRG